MMIKYIFIYLGLFFFLSSGFCAEEVNSSKVLTYADASVLFAKYLGFFDGYVKEDASLSECVSFLNKKGISFDLMDITSGVEFRKEDCARVFGQINLVLNGESQFLSGKVKLPFGIDSWGEYCILNGLNFIDIYQVMHEMVCVAQEQKD